MPSTAENFPRKNDRTFHQRCLSRARDEPAETPLAPVNYEETFIYRSSETDEDNIVEGTCRDIISAVQDHQKQAGWWRVCTGPVSKGWIPYLDIPNNRQNDEVWNMSCMIKSIWWGKWVFSLDNARQLGDNHLSTGRYHLNKPGINFNPCMDK